MGAANVLTFQPFGRTPMSTSIDAGMTVSASPDNPIAAAPHRDPYPYYARLVADEPLYRDDALGLWVASSADPVDAVLTSRLCRGRPPTEPVPPPLPGSPAGGPFRHRVRL